MGKFKVGDRVAVYGQPACGSFDCPTLEGDLGTVGEITESGWVRVKTDCDYGGQLDFHPKQCRRLKPKAKPREFWVIEFELGPKAGRSVAVRYSEEEAIVAQGKHVCAEIFHVREVVRKKSE